MIFSSQKKLPAYEFDIFKKFAPNFRHGIFTRNGGVSKDGFASLNVRFGIGDNDENVWENRKIICDAFGIEEKKLISANQTHSNHVQCIDDSFFSSNLKTQEKDSFNDVDAFVSNLQNVACMIQVADCQAQILYDPEHHVYGIVHAGWKGLVQDISGATINSLKTHFNSDPEKIIAGVAPSLGPCCAYFSDPKNELPENFHHFIDQKNRVDLWTFAIEQLQSHGIKNENIEFTKICTQCQGEEFFSFRRDKGITGRFEILAMLR